MEKGKKKKADPTVITQTFCNYFRHCRPFLLGSCVNMASEKSFLESPKAPK